MRSTKLVVKNKAKDPTGLNEHWQIIEKDSHQFNLEETPTPFCLSPSQRLQCVALAC